MTDRAHSPGSGPDAGQPAGEGTGPGAGDPLPLAGIAVLDVGTRISAPFCAAILGDLGADVIKVEEPNGGDFMRTIGPFLPPEATEAADTTGTGYSMWWAVEGRGRRGVTLDLRGQGGQDLWRRLAAKCDVVCENFRPGTMERWGIGPDDCDPRLVWARISLFGQDGPNSGRTGLDRMAIAYGGLLHLTGYADRPPVKPGLNVSDYLTGTFAASAVSAALLRRDGPGGTGRGGVVDAYLCGSVLRILEWTIAAEDRLGIVRQREGNRMSNSAPLDNYPTADGSYVCIVAGSNTNFQRLCAAMGRPAMAEDPQWATLAQRSARSEEINDIVAAWTSSLPAAEVEAVCITNDVPVATIYSATDIVSDAHFAARGDLVTVEDPIAGPHLQQAPFPRLDGRRPVAPRPAPRLGEHNEEVWCDLVGLSRRELDSYKDAGVI